MLRQNLNTFARNGVFEVEGFAEQLAARLRDPEEIRRARVFPYQLMVAFTMAGAEVPGVVRDALQDAMEIAIGNVPRIDGNVVVCPDVSGSMALAGDRLPQGRDVGGALHRRGGPGGGGDAAAQPDGAGAAVRERCGGYPTSTPRDTVMTNAAKLAAIGGGGTNCSAPLARLVREKAKVDLVVFVSDNQSWVDASAHAHQGTATMQEWAEAEGVEPGGQAGLHRHPALRDDAGEAAGRHPECRRLLRRASST